MIVAAFNFAYKVKRMHQSARRGVISLIPKSGRNPLYLKSWRPICLLCADYKLISKTIANRVKMFLDQIVGRDQCGFLKGRNASENIRKVLDTITYADKHNINAFLINIDYEKAFEPSRL